MGVINIFRIMGGGGENLISCGTQRGFNCVGFVFFLRQQVDGYTMFIIFFLLFCVSDI